MRWIGSAFVAGPHYALCPPPTDSPACCTLRPRSYARGSRSQGLPAATQAAKGAIREDYLTDFLREHLPRTVDVYGSAEIVTADGQISPQCDVLTRIRD